MCDMLIPLYIGESSCWSGLKMNPMLSAVRRPGFSETAGSHVSHREAGRHGLHLGAIPVLARRHPDHLPKHAAEGTQAGEPDVEADVGDASLRLAEHEHCPLHAA